MKDVLVHKIKTSPISYVQENNQPKFDISACSLDSMKPKCQQWSLGSAV